MAATMSIPLTAPKEALMSPLGDDPLTAEQWATLVAIAYAIVPSVQIDAKADRNVHLALREDEYSETFRRFKAHSNEKDDALVKQYLGESATTCTPFREGVYRILGKGTTQNAKKDLLTVLNLLN